MASQDTVSEFSVNCPDAFSTLEMKRTVAASDASLQWEIVMHVTAAAAANQYELIVEVTALSKENPPQKKFVFATIQLYIGQSQCSQSCYNYGCTPSYHTGSVTSEIPLSNNFHFKSDVVKVTQTSTMNQNISGRNVTVRYFTVWVTLRHFKTVVQEPVLSPVGPCVISNLQRLLESGEMSDVSFIVDGEEIKAHSQILGAASDVFKAMFRHDTQDRRSGRITVEDVTASIFREMLRCVYTDCKPAWKDDEYADDFLVGLLFLAEKYLLVSLRGECQRRLISTMSVENVVVRLKAVNVISPCLVPLLADPFVRTHLTQILSSEAWGEFMKEDVALAADVMFLAMKR